MKPTNTANTYVGKPKRVWQPGPVWVERPIKRIGDFYGDLTEGDRKLVKIFTRAAGRIPAHVVQKGLCFFERRAIENVERLASEAKYKSYLDPAEGDEPQGYSGDNKAPSGSGARLNFDGSEPGISGGSPEVRAVQLESGRRAIEHLPFSSETPPSEVVERGGSGPDNKD